MMNIRIRPLTLVLVLPLVGLGLAGCAGQVAMKPAADANNPECANVTVRLPDTVANLEKRETNAQATGAWGTPAAILLSCGVATPGPSLLPCVSINDIDWIEDDSEAPLYRYTTYGRTPAVEVVIDSDVVSGTTTLVDLGPAVSVLPVDATCTDISDAFSQ